MAKRQISYLYLRGTTWWVKIQPPGQKMIRRSLGTSDRLQAEVVAGPMIHEHKRTRLEAARRREGRYTITESDFLFPLGDSLRDDGTQVKANDHYAVLTAPDGSQLEVENYRVARTVVRQIWPGDLTDPYVLLTPPKPKLEPKADPDLKLLQDFLDLQPRTKHYEADARRTWARWKEFVDHRPLSKCTRDDGRAFVKHLRAQDPPPAPVSVRKWISLLKAPIAHGLPKHDPRQDIFHKLIGKVERQTIRIPLTEADMALVREKALPTQGPEETRMWAMMAMTGMRPSECTAVREEFEESGVRYLLVGVGDKKAKSTTSIRRVPIPDALMPFLPDRITGPLFTKDEVRLGANLLRAMRRIGITDKRKVVYSLRHRAHDRLRGVRCPPDIQREIVGHDIETVHNYYGAGSPMWMLKEWIEHIGY